MVFAAFALWRLWPCLRALGRRWADTDALADLARAMAGAPMALLLQGLPLLALFVGAVASR